MGRAVRHGQKQAGTLKGRSKGLTWAALYARRVCSAASLRCSLVWNSAR